MQYKISDQDFRAPSTTKRKREHRLLFGCLDSLLAAERISVISCCLGNRCIAWPDDENRQTGKRSISSIRSSSQQLSCILALAKIWSLKSSITSLSYPLIPLSCLSSYYRLYPVLLHLSVAARSLHSIPTSNPFDHLRSSRPTALHLAFSASEDRGSTRSLLRNTGANNTQVLRSPCFISSLPTNNFIASVDTPRRPRGLVTVFASSIL